jgi:hypothetical protein
LVSNLIPSHFKREHEPADFRSNCQTAASSHHPVSLSALCGAHSGLASSIEPRILLLIVVILILALALIVVSVSRVRTISRTVHIEERIQRIEDMGTLYSVLWK